MTELTGGPLDPRPASLGRQHDAHHRGAAHDPGLHLWRLQEATRSHLDGGRHIAADHAGVRAYRLPAAWDNRAYLGTVVTTHIASQAPMLGPYMSAITGRPGRQRRQRHFLAFLCAPYRAAAAADHHPHRRFTFIWSASMASLPPWATRLPNASSFPSRFSKTRSASPIAFIILFIMAVVAKVPLERLADPTDTAYIPRPEWYFLFLFQMLSFWPIGNRRQRGVARRRPSSRCSWFHSSTAGP